MPEKDQLGILLGSISELHKKIDAGFERVYDEIEGVCDRLRPLEEDKIRRDALNHARIAQDKKNVDWGKVKTAMVIAAATFLTVAAIKVILIDPQILLKASVR